jgi:hypothetical protein
LDVFSNFINTLLVCTDKNVINSICLISSDVILVENRR